MNLKHFFTTTCLAMCVSFSAQAVIIDHGDFLSDTDSGLDWLDVTKSRNMSINSVNAQLGTGGTFEGWRYATGNEFNALITHFTGITINTFDRTPIPVDDAFNLVVMLGQTGLFFNSRQAENVTLGILSDKNSVGGFWTAQINWTEQNAFPTNILQEAFGRMPVLLTTAISAARIWEAFWYAQQPLIPGQSIRFQSHPS